eukprot:9492215-Pyramimonas_sp.AAC.2
MQTVDVGRREPRVQTIGAAPSPRPRSTRPPSAHFFPQRRKKRAKELAEGGPEDALRLHRGHAALRVLVPEGKKQQDGVVREREGRTVREARRQDGKGREKAGR